MIKKRDTSIRYQNKHPEQTLTERREEKEKPDATKQTLTDIYRTKAKRINYDDEGAGEMNTRRDLGRRERFDWRRERESSSSRDI